MSLNRYIDTIPRETRFMVVMIWVAVFSMLAGVLNNTDNTGLAVLAVVVMASPLLFRVPYIHGWIR